MDESARRQLPPGRHRRSAALRLLNPLRTKSGLATFAQRSGSPHQFDVLDVPAGWRTRSLAAEETSNESTIQRRRF